jgi:hypothetical protein
MNADAKQQAVGWSVANTEPLHSLQQVQRHGGDFSCVLNAIADRQTAHLHSTARNSAQTSAAGLRKTQHP